MRRGKYIYIFFKNHENFIRKLNSTTSITIGCSVFSLITTLNRKSKISDLCSMQNEFYNIFYKFPLYF